MITQIDFSKAPIDVMGSSFRVDLIGQDGFSRNSFYSKKVGFNETSNKVGLLINLLERLICKHECFNKVKNDSVKSKNRLIDYIEVFRLVHYGEYEICLRIFSYEHKGEWIEPVNSTFENNKTVLSQIKNLLFAARSNKPIVVENRMSIIRSFTFIQMNKVDFEKYYFELEQRFGTNNRQLIEYKEAYLKRYPQVSGQGFIHKNYLKLWERLMVLMEQEIGPNDFRHHIENKIQFLRFNSEKKELFLIVKDVSWLSKFKEKYAKIFFDLIKMVFGQVSIFTSIQDKT